MLKVYFGEDRLGVEAAVKEELGEDYEVFDGEDLEVADLPSIFQGTSLFGGDDRRILLKNLGENLAVWEKVVDYAETEHRVIVWEGKIDKRSAGYKRLKSSGVELKEFTETKVPDMKMVFGVFDVALRNGAEAVKMLEQIEDNQDPYMFFGLMVTQALKKFEYSRGGAREKRILKELAKVDMLMKSSSIEPWNLVKGVLLRLGEL